MPILPSARAARRCSRPRRVPAVSVVLPLALATVLLGTPASAAPSDDTQPDLVALLAGFGDLWDSDGVNDLHGTVLDGPTLARNDEVVVWVNNHATATQQFSALQTSEYDGSGSSYDESITLAPALGSVLAPLYVLGRQDGGLRLTSAVISSEDGSSGDYVSGVDAAKDTYSYPRPFLASDPARPPAGEPCTAQNGSSLQTNRIGRDYADPVGNLDIVPVAPTVDTTHEFADQDVSLDPGYSGLCSAGSYPSGHTTTAYQAGITLATLLPELGPEILTRASEQANNRLVLGVHYPLDLMGGRISGEAGVAARWSDREYREQVLEPARAELITYLQDACGDVLTACLARGTTYQDDPYGGLPMPGGSAQIVTDRASAVATYGERLTYGFPAVGPVGVAPSVPAGAQNLLRSTFPTLDDAQRTAILAQTQLPSGYALDRSGPDGSWQRLDLAAAMSATVQLNSDASVTVIATGGPAQVVAPPPPTSTSTTSTPTPSTSTSTTSTSTTSTSSTSTSTTSTSTTSTTDTSSSTSPPSSDTPTASTDPVSSSTPPVSTGVTSRTTVAGTTVVSTRLLIAVVPEQPTADPGRLSAAGVDQAAAGRLADTGVAPAATVWTGLAVAAVGAALMVLGGVGRRRPGVRRGMEA